MSLKARHIINILCVPLIFYGVYFCFQGMETIKIADETYSWKTATGTITYSGVEKSQNNNGKRTAVYRKPVIKYAYSVNNIHYQGNTIYWGDDKSPASVSYTDNIVSKYPKNKEIIVHYNPIDPQKSVLETGTSEVTFVPLVHGGILLFFGTLFPVVFFVFRKSPTESMKFKFRK